MKVKKRVIKNIITSLFILVITILGINIVIAACSGTDLFTTRIRDPLGTQIQSCTQQTINPTGGDDCNTASSTTCSDYIPCQRVGIYTAEITCDTCSVHSAVSSENILSCIAPASNKFIIRDSLSANVASFDENGNIYLLGGNATNLGSLSPPANSFIVQNSGGTPVAYIDSNGNLNLLGTVTEFQATLTPPANSFVIKNSSSQNVAYFDDSGNLQLTGGLYETWLESI